MSLSAVLQFMDRHQSHLLVGLCIDLSIIITVLYSDVFITDGCPDGSTPQSPYSCSNDSVCDPSSTSNICMNGMCCPSKCLEELTS